jgi:hypothetical protein
MMKEIIPKPVHESYQRHRRQLIGQVILPMVLAALLFVALIVLISLATFRGNGDSARWAEISTMWIAIPVLIAGFIFLALLVGIIYLLARLLGIAPTYTNRAQDFVQKLAIRIQGAADLPVRPILFLDGIGASIRALLGRK